MPKSAMQKEKRRVKRAAAKARKRAARAAVTQNLAQGVHLGGGGRYKATRMRRTLAGHGGYSLSDIANGVSSVANYAPSTAVGGLAQKGASALAADLGLPKPLSSALGNAAGWVTKLFGFGDYSTFNNLNKNSFLSSGWLKPGQSGSSGFMTNAPPSFAGGRGPTVRIQHDEFIQDVEASADFAKITFPLNPGNPNLMPWGSQMARLYEECKWMGCVIEYRPTAAFATSATNLGLGVVIHATDYDPYDDAFIDKRSMENAKFASSGTPCEHVFHPIECAKRDTPTNVMYVQPGITSSDQAPGDQRFAVLGNYTLATVGQNMDGVTNAKIGELWIHYDIELSCPILTLSSTSFSQHIQASYVSAAVTFTGNTNPATGFSPTQGDQTTTCINLTKNISVPSGTYLLTVITKLNSDTVTYASVPIVEVGVADGGSLPEIPNLLTSAAGAENSLDCFNSGAIFTATPNPIRSTVSTMIATFDEDGQYYTINLPVGSTGTNYVDIFLTEWNSTYNAKREKAWARMNSSVRGNVDTLSEKLARLELMMKTLTNSQLPDMSGSSSSGILGQSNSVLAVRDTPPSQYQEDVPHDSPVLVRSEVEESNPTASWLRRSLLPASQLSGFKSKS